MLQAIDSGYKEELAHSKEIEEELTNPPKEEPEIDQEGALEKKGFQPLP